MDNTMADKRDYLGSGLKFPLQVTPDGRLAQSRNESLIEESIFLILSTRVGERLMLPDFGTGIHDQLFALNNVGTHGLIRHQIQESLLTYEPRIDLLDVTLEVPPEGATQLLVKIAYRIRASNAIGNLVYPFFITENN